MAYSVYGGFILMRIGNWFIIKALTMPIVVSKTQHSFCLFHNKTFL